jgi:cold shock CspA family protein
MGVHADIGYRESAADREQGKIVFFDVVRGFGFCCPDSADPTDKSQHLYVSVHAVKRAGLTSLSKGDTITCVREQSRHPGQKPEVQQIGIVERAA